MALTQVPQSLIIPPTGGPAFFARSGLTQSVASGAFTRVGLGAEVFDTDNCFDSTQFRFTPNVAGYYFFQGRIQMVGTTTNTGSVAYIYKNGSVDTVGPTLSGATTQNPVVSTMLLMNGTTDYVELYGTLTGTGTLTMQGGQQTAFMGYLARTL